MENKFYHISRRSIREGATLTQGIYGERIIDQHTVESNYELYIKEKIFEDVRVLQFPELPSRLNCVFLYSNLEIAKFYWAYKHLYQAYIYEVEIVYGEPFLAEMDLLNCIKCAIRKCKAMQKNTGRKLIIQIVLHWNAY